MSLLQCIDKNSGEPIPLVSVAVSFAIAGPLAETTILLTLRNDGDLDAEAELEVPMEDGASVCGYAVDVNGQLIDAVVVEKEKARATFEAEVREKRGGPAMIEQAQGNVFKTRIYPVPKQGTRQAKIVVMQDLSGFQEDGRQFWRFDFPLKFADTLEEFSLAFQIDGVSPAPPRVLSEQFGDTRVVQDGERKTEFRLLARRRNFQPNERLTLLLPDSDQFLLIQQVQLSFLSEGRERRGSDRDGK